MEDGLPGAGVAEGDIAKLHRPGLGHLRAGAVLEGGGGLQHLREALGRGRAPGHVLEDHGHGGDAAQNLGGVGDGGHDIAWGDAPGLDLDAAHVDDGHHRRIHDDVHDGGHAGKEGQGLQLGVHQGLVGLAETGLLPGFLDVGLHHPGPGDVLLHDGVDLVQLLLELGEDGRGLAQEVDDREEHQGQGAGHHRAEAEIQPQHEPDAAHKEHRSPDAPGKGAHHGLHLGDIVGEAGDEGAGGEPVRLLKAQVHDPAEAVLSHVVGELLAGNGAEHPAQDAAAGPQDHQADHPSAQADDQPQVPHSVVVEAQHAVVHDAAHEAGLHEVHGDLSDHGQLGQKAEEEIGLEVGEDPFHPSPPPSRGLGRWWGWLWGSRSSQLSRSFVRSSKRRSCSALSRAFMSSWLSRRRFSWRRRL